jgi:hypothetical protein
MQKKTQRLALRLSFILKYLLWFVFSIYFQISLIRAASQRPRGCVFGVCV